MVTPEIATRLRIFPFEKFVLPFHDVGILQDFLVLGRPAPGVGTTKVSDQILQRPCIPAAGGQRQDQYMAHRGKPAKRRLERRSLFQIQRLSVLCGKQGRNAGSLVFAGTR